MGTGAKKSLKPVDSACCSVASSEANMPRIMRQQMDQYRDQVAQEREVMQRKLDEYHDQAAQLEIQIRQMKEEAEMIDEELKRKQSELKS